MATRTEKCNEVLRGIRRAAPAVIGATIVNRDGFIVSSVLPNEVDEELIGGMAASMLGVGERISVDLMGSEMEQTYVRTQRGTIVLHAIADEAAVVLLVSGEAKLGMVFLELRRAAAELRKYL
ncbi:MAG: roadblock/LC7 domain-containing protein [Myxococcales bacterium]|jgi:uncharacterized protein|nr:roadblock/LC7 domain-containing protein [Myxococcales bacterium]